MELEKLDKKLLQSAKYNVLNLKPESKVLRSFPKLKEWPEFMEDYGKIVLLPNENILRFCLLFYQDSDFHNIDSDIMKRKRIAAEWSGFELEKGERFPDKLEEILLGKNEHVNKLIVRILRLTSDHLFQRYIVFEETRARLYMKLYEDSMTKNEKTKEIIENIQNLSNILEDIERQMLREDRNTLIREALYAEATKESLPTPENIAEAKRKGTFDNLIDPPYDLEHIRFGGVKKFK